MIIVVDYNGATINAEYPAAAIRFAANVYDRGDNIIYVSNLLGRVTRTLTIDRSKTATRVVTRPATVTHRITDDSIASKEKTRTNIVTQIDEQWRTMTAHAGKTKEKTVTKEVPAGVFTGTHHRTVTVAAHTFTHYVTGEIIMSVEHWQTRTAWSGTVTRYRTRTKYFQGTKDRTITKARTRTRYYTATRCAATVTSYKTVEGAEPGCPNEAYCLANCADTYFVAWGAICGKAFSSPQQYDRSVANDCMWDGLLCTSDDGWGSVTALLMCGNPSAGTWTIGATFVYDEMLGDYCEGTATYAHISYSDCPDGTYTLQPASLCDYDCTGQSWPAEITLYS